MTFFKKVLLGAAVLGLAFSMTPNPVLAQKTINMTGSTTVLPFAQITAEAFMKKHPDVNISVAGTGSGDGVKAIIDGTADIGNSSREIKDKEIKMAKDKGVAMKIIPISIDVIIPVVHPSNSVGDLTLDQLKDIYTGKVKNWKEVGGPDSGIAVISRDSSSGTFGEWGKMVLKGEKVRPDAQLQASNGAVHQAVAGNKFAIGYVSLAYVDNSVKPVAIGGVSYNDAGFPTGRELYMLTQGEPKGVVKDYIDFVLGPEGQKLIVEANGIPINK
jgi:phosphate transport system substrate-binding protein